MSTQFFSKLSQNYIELLEDDEYYDITIEVGEEPNVKIIRAHMNILCYRSPYLRRALATKKQVKIMLWYIYGGILSLNHQNNSDILKLLLAADELLLQEVVEYLQAYLIEYNSEWMEQHFELIHRTSFQSNSLLEFQQFCIDLMANSPEKLFKSFDFTLLSEKSLIQLIKEMILQLKEIEVWEHLLKWRLAQNPTFFPDLNTWSDNDFKTMKNTFQHCLPLIRFFSLSSKEFSQKVHPYKKLLNHQLYKNLLNSHLDPDSEPTLNQLMTFYYLEASKFMELLIRKLDLYLPYKFQLLLRGSRDEFTPKIFHGLCDNKPNTVIFKVKGTEEILGGYNPIIWRSHGSGLWAKTKDSFIFSFKNNNVKGGIISDIEDTDRASWYDSGAGPFFGYDIIIYAHNSLHYNDIRYEQHYYEKKNKGRRSIWY
ncbi:hypothetical protein RclHR1_00120026 [Rhizophagus clarus]|uniref:TLDc domain-containing protein n=1 Tax=Rhizophagus clarus TaxID=94130 RepID=A0A2Z6QAL7_9GLOM|nr:hypothetical protein RclHR1_00120026 [Rhizophagus clarus]GES93508.1 hypothetical protein GLOIN_2v1868401 [Rhizophagus clarus]